MKVNLFVLLVSISFTLAVTLKSDKIGDCLHKLHYGDVNLTLICFKNVFTTDIIDVSNRTQCRDGRVTKDRVRFVNFKNCEMNQLPDGIFISYPYILDLDVSNMGLKTLEFEILQSIHLLKKLQASNNNLTQVPEFPETNKIENLDLSYNPLLQLSMEAFKNLTSLKELYLANINLTDLNADVFSYQRNLEIIDLSYNHLKRIDMSAFVPSFFKLQTIYLDHNEFTELDSAPKSLFDKLNLISVTGNKFTCEYLKNYLKENEMERSLRLSKDSVNIAIYEMHGENDICTNNVSQ